MREKRKRERKKREREREKERERERKSENAGFPNCIPIMLEYLDFVNCKGK